MYLRLNVGEYLHNKHIPTASTRNKIIIHQVSTTLPSLYFPLLRVPLTVFLTGAHACRCFLFPREAESPSYPPLLCNLASNQEAVQLSERTDSCTAVLLDCGLVSCWIDLKKMNGAFISLACTMHQRIHCCDLKLSLVAPTHSWKVFWSLFITVFSFFL